MRCSEVKIKYKTKQVDGIRRKSFFFSSSSRFKITSSLCDSVPKCVSIWYKYACVNIVVTSRQVLLREEEFNLLWGVWITFASRERLFDLAFCCIHINYFVYKNNYATTPSIFCHDIIVFLLFLLV